MKGITLIRRYEVKYCVNDKEYTENFSCFYESSPEVEIGGDLSDRFRGENRDILDIKRIRTPEEMQIPGLEEYYKRENENILDSNSQKNDT